MNYLYREKCDKFHITSNSSRAEGHVNIVLNQNSSSGVTCLNLYQAVNLVWKPPFLSDYASL